MAADFGRFCPAGTDAEPTLCRAAAFDIKFRHRDGEEKAEDLGDMEYLSASEASGQAVGAGL